MAAPDLGILTPEEIAELSRYADSANSTNGEQTNRTERDTGKVKTPVEPLLITMTEIPAEKVDWLWMDRIPLGRISLLDGDPASGKSFLTLAIAASVTRGDALPRGIRPSGPANVLLMSIEDGYSDTVRPRLDALGADVSKIVIPNPKKGLATTMLDATFVENAVKQVGPKLVVIDPIVAFLGQRNADKANEVRQFLSPLMALAQKHSFACIIVRHFTKQIDTRAIYRGGGSVDFMAASRAAFIIVESEEEPGLRVLAQVKNSLGPKSSSLGFHIDSNGFRWGNEVEKDADELLGEKRTENRKRERTQLDAATGFLKKVLVNGEIPSNNVKEQAERAGLAWRTIWRAKDELGVKASKERGTGEWLWRLP